MLFFKNIPFSNTLGVYFRIPPNIIGPFRPKQVPVAGESP